MSCTPRSKKPFPTNSFLLQKKWRQRDYERHQDKVSEMKPGIDNNTPREYPHLTTRLKQTQMAEERTKEINRENKLLLNKMEAINRNGGGVDNRNDYTHHSLNKPYIDRQRRLVEQENMKILKHLNAIKPIYHVQNWERDYAKHEQYMEMRSSMTKEYELESKQKRTPRSKTENTSQEKEKSDKSESKSESKEDREDKEKREETASGDESSPPSSRRKTQPKKSKNQEEKYFDEDSDTEENKEPETDRRKENPKKTETKKGAYSYYDSPYSPRKAKNKPKQAKKESEVNKKQEKEKKKNENKDSSDESNSDKEE